MISFNMLEAARLAGCKRFFYASSACIYPEYKQLDTEVEGGGLKEADAWPAQVSRGAGAGRGRGARLRALCLVIALHCLVLEGASHVQKVPGWRGLHCAALLTHRPPRLLCAYCAAQPQDAYGLEKLVTEELCMHYDKDFGMDCRIARFHNIYGPYGTWKVRAAPW